MFQTTNQFLYFQTTKIWGKFHKTPHFMELIIGVNVLKPSHLCYIGYSKPISIDFINESQLLHRFNSPPPSTGSRKRRHRGSTAHGTRGRGWFDLARRTRGGKRLMVEVNMVCSNLKRYKYTLFFPKF